MYQIFGDYGYTNETLLEEFDSLDEAIRWVNGYTEDGDLGGYDRIEVCTFAEDGELIVYYQIESDPTVDYALED